MSFGDERDFRIDSCACGADLELELTSPTVKCWRCGRAYSLCAQCGRPSPGDAVTCGCASRAARRAAHGMQIQVLRRRTARGSAKRPATWSRAEFDLVSAWAGAEREVTAKSPLRHDD